jgi:hypothetical protein
MSAKRVVTAVILGVFSTLTLAGDQNVTGLFSTFRNSERSGDITGAEIHVVQSPSGFSAIVQASEGAPGYPEVLQIGVSGRTITFTVPETSATGFAPGNYRGTVTAKGLRLRGPKGQYEDYFLPRKPSCWQ